jgi:hypothetical protein
MARATDIQQGRLKLVKTARPAAPTHGLRTIDLFSGAGGITEGFRQQGTSAFTRTTPCPKR